MRQHGEYHIEWREPILWVRYQGTWNVQAVEALHAEVRSFWTQDPQRRWAMLTDAREWEGGTPEVFARWWDFFTDAVAHGLDAVSDVLPSSFHALLVRDLAERAQAITRFQHSASVQEAQAWLASQGYGKV